MKKTIIYAFALVAFAACGTKNNDDAQTKGNAVVAKETWAEGVKSRTIFKLDSAFLQSYDPAGDLSGSKMIEKEKIIKTLFDMAKSGNYKVTYALFDDGTVLTKEQIQEKTEKLENIGIATFDEDWHFNAEKKTIEKTVKRVCLSKAVYAENGELKGQSPLFWLEFNH